MNSTAQAAAGEASATAHMAINSMEVLLSYVETCICYNHNMYVVTDESEQINSVEVRSHVSGGRIFDDDSSYDDGYSGSGSGYLDLDQHHRAGLTMCPFGNKPEVDDADDHQLTLRRIEDVLYCRVAVALATVGLVGNAISFFVLASTLRRRSSHRRSRCSGRQNHDNDRSRRSTSNCGTCVGAGGSGLVTNGNGGGGGRIQQFAGLAMAALTASDALFCLCVLPLGVLERDPIWTSVGPSIVYSMYSETIINVFVMFSTWMTVAMAVGRLAATIRPLQARVIIGRRMALRCIVGVFVVCALLNTPRAFWNDLRSVTCRGSDGDLDGADQEFTSGSFFNGSESNAADSSSTTYYFRWHGYLHAYNRPALERTYFWFYSFVAILFPLGLLVVISAWLFFRLRPRFRTASPVAGGGHGLSNRLHDDVDVGGDGRRCQFSVPPTKSMQLNNLNRSTRRSCDIGETSLHDLIDDIPSGSGRHEPAAGNIHRSRSKSPSPSYYTSTLLAVAVTHVLLVCPAELLTIVRQRLPLSDYETSDIVGLNYADTAAQPVSPSSLKSTGSVDYNFLSAILNTIQTVNFAFNFLLYCVVNAPFRRLLVREVGNWMSGLRRSLPCFYCGGGCCCCCCKCRVVNNCQRQHHCCFACRCRQTRKHDRRTDTEYSIVLEPATATGNELQTMME